MMSNNDGSNGSKQPPHGHDHNKDHGHGASIAGGGGSQGGTSGVEQHGAPWHHSSSRPSPPPPPPPPPHFSSSGAPYPSYHHHHRPSNGPPGGYRRDSPNMKHHHQHHHGGHPMMHSGGHPDAGYPPHPMEQHSHHSMHSHHPGDSYYHHQHHHQPSHHHQPPPHHQHHHPGPYYGQQGHAPGPSHPMGHHDAYYPYSGGGGHHAPYQRPPDEIDYARGGGDPHQHHQHHPGYNMHYGHHPQAGDPRLQQHPNSYPEHSGYGMYPSMDPSHNNNMYMHEPHRQSYPPPSSYSMESASSMGQQQVRGNDRDRRYSFPSHVGLRSIADDNTSKSSSSPAIPPPPDLHEPHEISAPSSLDETDGSGGPLRQSGLVNRGGEQQQQYALEGALPPELGSSEKKEAIDTASVLLAFSSTKKRPASTTSTIDDTDALSLATMSTLPHSIAPPDHHHSVCFPPPTEYPQRLAQPEDKERLNQLHCYIRSELLELVVIQPADGTQDRDSFGKIQTSTDPQQIGRVGLRCVHCSMSADGGRTGPSMAIFYPKSTGEIYRLVTSWKRCHLRKCKNIPKSVRDELNRLGEVKARGKTSYWSDSAAELGLINMPTKIGGICFSPTAENVSRTETFTPVKLTATLPSETTQTTVTADTSPDSLPTISDTSTLVSAMAKKQIDVSKREEDEEAAEPDKKEPEVLHL